MLSKDIEQIKYKDSHGREVIPLWRLQDLLKEVKKEAFEKGYVKGFKERINKTLVSSHNEPKTKDKEA